MARMCRIRAINEESDSEEEDDTGVTREIEVYMTITSINKIYNLCFYNYFV